VDTRIIFNTAAAEVASASGLKSTAPPGARSKGESMKRSIVVCVMVMLVALPIAAGEGKKCSHSTDECLNYMASNLKDRGWVGIEYDEDTMKVTRVMPDSPAEAAGFKAGDVMTAVNGIEMGEANKAELKKLEWKPGNTMVYTVDRNGAMKEVKVTLAPIPETVLAQWIGSHMLAAHTEMKVASLDQ
jgi:membrane-associated protease RseP (regulator of RpoE activity)